MSAQVRRARAEPHSWDVNGVYLLWHACGIVIVVLLPTLSRLGLPFWEVPTRLLPQVPALAVGYLGTALVIGFVPRAESVFNAWRHGWPGRSSSARRSSSSRISPGSTTHES